MFTRKRFRKFEYISRPTQYRFSEIHAECITQRSANLGVPTPCVYLPPRSFHVLPLLISEQIESAYKRVFCFSRIQNHERHGNLQRTFQPDCSWQHYILNNSRKLKYGTIQNSLILHFEKRKFLYELGSSQNVPRGIKETLPQN